MNRGGKRLKWRSIENTEPHANEHGGGIDVSAAGARAHQMGMAAQQSQDEAQITAMDRADGAAEGGSGGDETGQQPGMDIAEAADLLGLPVPTLRKRLQRGTQKGFKSDDGTWRVIIEAETRNPIDRQARRAVSRGIGEGVRPPDWGRGAALGRQDGAFQADGSHTAALEMLAGEIRDLREEIERNSALLESTQWQIAQINPPGQFQHLQNHTETMIENQLRPVVSALMAVLDYLDRERDEGRKAQRPLAAKK